MPAAEGDPAYPVNLFAHVFACREASYSLRLMISAEMAKARKMTSNS